MVPKSVRPAMIRNCQCLMQNVRIVLKGGLGGATAYSLCSGSMFMWSANSLNSCFSSVSPLHHIDILLSSFIFMYSNVTGDLPGKGD